MTPTTTLKSRAKSPRKRSEENTYHHGDLRNALIFEARKLLEEVGLRDLSLREVARRVGVSEAAHVRHFSGKDALLAAVAQSGYEELSAERVKILAEGLDSLEVMRRMMKAYVALAQRHAGMFNLMAGPKIIDRSAYPELLYSSDRSFSLFAESVCSYAEKHGWPKSQMGAVVTSAWATEHGLANLILSRRVPRADQYYVSEGEMVEFSLALMAAGISGGPTLVARLRNQ